MSLPYESSEVEWLKEAGLENSSDEGVTDTPPSMHPPQLLSVGEVQELLQWHKDSSQRPGLYSNRSFGLKFAYSLLHHADTLEESIIPKHRNRSKSNPINSVRQAELTAFFLRQVYPMCKAAASSCIKKMGVTPQKVLAQR